MKHIPSTSGSVAPALAPFFASLGLFLVRAMGLETSSLFPDCPSFHTALSPTVAGICFVM